MKKRIILFVNVGLQHSLGKEDSLIRCSNGTAVTYKRVLCSSRFLSLGQDGIH